MSGRLEDLSVKQKEKLQKFKTLIEDVLTTQHGDGMLLKFMKARKFDLKKSESMFRKHLEWREINQVDAILQDYEPPEILLKYYPSGIIGPNKEGYLTLFSPSDIDLRGLLHCYKGSEIIKFAIWKLESFQSKIEEHSKKLGRLDLDQLFTICDAEGVGMKTLWKPGMELMSQLSATMEENYPEIQRELWVINTPPIFQKVYSLLKHLFKREVRQKWKILGGNWKEELLAVVDADVLPAHYGGNATDPDGNPRCVTKIGTPDKVPESYYIKDRYVTSTDLKTREIERGSTLELKYEVTKEGAVLRYEFFTKTHDIAFGIKKLNTDGTKTEILKKQKYNCFLIPEDSTVNMHDVGTYVVKFDNRYSMLRSKTLSYWVALLEPTDDDDREDGYANHDESLCGSAGNGSL